MYMYIPFFFHVCFVLLFVCCFCLLFIFNFFCCLVHLPLVKLRTRCYGRMRCCIAKFLNSASAVAVVDSKVTEVRGNFVEDEYYQMATEF